MPQSRMGDPIDITIDCFCEPCPVCKKCKEDYLKSLDLSGEPGSEPGDIDDAPGYLCPVCECPAPPMVKDTALYSHEKLKCVYLKLKETTILKDLVSKYVGSDKYNLNYVVVDGSLGKNGMQRYGGCIVNKDRSVTISINSYYFDRVAPVFLAKTILHETIHANIYQKLESVGGFDNLSINNFERLYQYFENYGAKLFQHNYMVEKYIPTLALALLDFDNGRYSLEVYKAIAWSGLHETYGWSEVLTLEQRMAIENIWEMINSGNIECVE